MIVSVQISRAPTEPRLIPNAGLLLPAILAQRLDLGRLIDEQVDLGKAVGPAHPGAKAMTLIASQLAGGDCISQADSLRGPGWRKSWGHRIFAPSTLGTFKNDPLNWPHLRAF